MTSYLGYKIMNYNNNKTGTRESIRSDLVICFKSIYGYCTTELVNLNLKII